jgi:hypothetical protein
MGHEKAFTPKIPVAVQCPRCGAATTTDELVYSDWPEPLCVDCAHELEELSEIADLEEEDVAGWGS